MTFKELQKYCFDSSDSKHAYKLIFQEGKTVFIIWDKYGQVTVFNTVLPPGLVAQLATEKSIAINECEVEGLCRVMAEFSDHTVKVDMFEEVK